MEVRGVCRQQRDTDMLGHADTRDRVERPVADISVVLHPDLHPLGDALGDHPFARILRLLVRQSHAHDMYTVIARRVQGEGPPSAADVEHPHARSQAQLAGHQIALSVLSRVQILAACAQYPHE